MIVFETHNFRMQGYYYRSRSASRPYHVQHVRRRWNIPHIVQISFGPFQTELAGRVVKLDSEVQRCLYSRLLTSRRKISGACRLEEILVDWLA